VSRIDTPGHRRTVLFALWLCALVTAATAFPVPQQPEATDGPTQIASSPVAPIAAQPLDGVGARNAARLLSDQSGEVDGAVIWTSRGAVGSGEQLSIQVLVEVDGRGLLADTPYLPIPIDVHGYVLDDTGALIANLSQSLLLEDDRQAQRVEDTGLKLVTGLRLSSGSYSFRALVCNRQTQRCFLGGHGLGFQTADPPAPFLLPPLVADPPDSWVIGFQHGLQINDLFDGLPGLASWPSAKPIWRAGESLKLVLGGSELIAGRRLSARLLDRHGQQVLDPELEVGPQVTAVPGLVFLSASVVAPNVAAGEYRLEVFFTGDNANEVSTQLPVLIDDQADTVVWTDPDAPRVKRPAPTPPSQPSSVDLEATGATESPSHETPSAAEALDTDLDRFVGGSEDELPPAGTIETLSLGGVSARGVALLLSGQSGGEVSGSVVWTGGGLATGAELSLQVFVEVDGGQLLAGSSQLPIPIEVYGYLLDRSGNLAGHISAGLLVDGRLLAQRIDQTGVKFVGELSAPPDLYSFRIVVRNRRTQRFFLARRDLDFRIENPPDLLLLPPLLAEPQDSWVIAGEHSMELDSVQNEIPGIGSWPSARPTWRADAPIEMVIGCSKLDEGRQLSARLLDRFGQPVLDPNVEVGQPVATTDSLTFYDVRIAAPDTPLGEYRLVVEMTDTNSGTTVSQSLPVLIHDRDSAFVWTDSAAGEIVQVAATKPAGADQPTPEDLAVETIRAAYLEALQLWSEQQAVAARRRLAELERPLQSTATPRGWRQLVTVERLTALTLARSKPASLMALALLHRDMFSWYQARREPQLARHSWQMAAMLARTASTINGWQPPDRFREYLLLDLANRLIRSGQRHPTQQLLEATVEIAPASAPALLRLGALHERTGSPDEAVDYLEKLYRKHPGNLEGRLRLAVNQVRIEKDKAAEELLRGLLAPSAPLWIQTLAYQELGRLLTGNDRGNEAEVLLRKGVAQIPGNQRLQVLLAHTLDQTRQPQEAGTVIDQLETHASQQSTSPRYRYSLWPDLDTDRILATLNTAHSIGLEALQEALP
jgi:tetratricopeptide (TPR) repeat protein